MEDTYVIRSRIVVDANASDPGLRRINAQFQALDRRIQRVGARIDGLFSRAFTGYALYWGVKRVVGGIIEMNDEIDRATIGLAALFTANTGTPFERSMGVATNQIRTLEKLAARGVGEFSDYLMAFQQVAAPSLAAGKTIPQINELVRLAMGASDAINPQMGLRLAPYDLQQAMNIGLGERTTPIINLALRAVGVGQKEFNAMGSAERFDTLMTAFTRYLPAIVAQSQTMGAQLDTMWDNLRRFARLTTRPLFNRWRDELIDINRYLEKNEDAINRILTRVGLATAKSWDGVVGNAGQIGLSSLGLAAGGLGLRFVPGALAGAGGGGAAAGAAGAVGIGGVAAGAGVIIGGMLFLIASLWGALSQWPELLGTVAWGLNALWGGIQIVADAFYLWADPGSPINYYGAFLVNLLAGLAVVIGTVIAALGVLVAVVDLIGESLMNSMMWFGEKASGAGPAADLNYRARNAATWEKYHGFMDRTGATLQSMWSGEGGITEGDIDGFLKKLLDEGLLTPSNIVNVGKMEVTVQAVVNEDPARVAVAFEEVIDNLMRNRTQARRNFGWKGV